MSKMKERWAELEQAAKDATPGPWSHWTRSGMHQIETKTKTVVHWSGFDQLQTPNERGAVASNAAYIAAANPTNILELLSINAELAEALDGVMYWDNGKPEWNTARAALAKYEGVQSALTKDQS